jgi:hypothetical protein
LDLSHE